MSEHGSLNGSGTETQQQGNTLETYNLYFLGHEVVWVT
jgi:hypothetical protein